MASLHDLPYPVHAGERSEGELSDSDIEGDNDPFLGKVGDDLEKPYLTHVGEISETEKSDVVEVGESEYPRPHAPKLNMSGSDEFENSVPPLEIQLHLSESESPSVHSSYSGSDSETSVLSLTEHTPEIGAVEVVTTSIPDNSHMSAEAVATTPMPDNSEVLNLSVKHDTYNPEPSTSADSPDSPSAEERDCPSLKRKAENDPDINFLTKHFRYDQTSPSSSSEDDESSTEGDDPLEMANLAKHSLDIVLAPYFDLTYPLKDRCILTMAKSMEDLTEMTCELKMLHNRIAHGSRRVYYIDLIKSCIKTHVIDIMSDVMIQLASDIDTIDVIMVEFGKTLNRFVKDINFIMPHTHFEDEKHMASYRQLVLDRTIISVSVELASIVDPELDKYNAVTVNNDCTVMVYCFLARMAKETVQSKLRYLVKDEISRRMHIHRTYQH